MGEERLSRAEMLALLGGVLLLLGLFLGWYHADNARNVIAGEPGPVTVSGWEAHPTMRWLLLLAALAPFILAYIVVRGHALSWPRGELTAVVSLAAFVLVGYNALLDRPGTVSSLTSLRVGALVALLGTVLMFVGSALRSSSVERARKPPGVL